MTRTAHKDSPRTRLLILVALVIIVAAGVLAAASPPPASAGGLPAPGARAPSFTVTIFTNGTSNGTKNGTGNTTKEPCSPAANDYCYQQLTAILQDWTRFSSNVAPWIDFVLYGFVIFVAVNVVAWALVIRFVRREREAMKQDRVGAEDYRNYDLFEEVFNALLPRGSRERESLAKLSLEEKKRAVQKEIAELNALQAAKAKEA